jgi:hypothetical protein
MLAGFQNNFPSPVQDVDEFIREEIGTADSVARSESQVQADRPNASVSMTHGGMAIAIPLQPMLRHQTVASDRAGLRGAESVLSDETHAPKLLFEMG